jgi:arginine/ornithine transport system substrate-binding protein
MNKTGLLGALAFCACSALPTPMKQACGSASRRPTRPFPTARPKASIAGFDYDIGNALCAQMQVKCQWVIQEFDGMIPSLKVRKIDAVLSSMSITEDRKKSVDFTNRYYHTPASSR